MTRAISAPTRAPRAVNTLVRFLVRHQEHVGLRDPTPVETAAFVAAVAAIEKQGAPPVLETSILEIERSGSDLGVKLRRYLRCGKHPVAEWEFWLLGEMAPPSGIWISERFEWKPTHDEWLFRLGFDLDDLPRLPDEEILEALPEARVIDIPRVNEMSDDAGLAFGRRLPSSGKKALRRRIMKGTTRRAR